MFPNYRFVWFFGLAALLLTAPVALAQKSKAELEEERKENQQKIEEAGRILEETTSEKKVTIGQLNALNQQVSARRRLINSINSEINLLTQDMSEIDIIKLSLERDMAKLRSEYATMLYAASKATVHDRLMFILSAPTFNSMVMRVQYMKQYSEMRREQVEVIRRVSRTLESQQVKLVSKKKQKVTLLVAQLSENEKLQALKGQQKELVQQLSARERELRADLQARQDADQRMERMIADLVRREMRRAAREAREANREVAEENKITLTPEAAQLSNSFAGNKSRLIWPVASGFISGKFGRQPHPVLPRVYVDNLGVNIQTNQGEDVRAVFKGTVGFIANMPGAGTLVTIIHGDYFTVYGNLKDVSVKAGQKVKAKDRIGEVMTDKDGAAELQFQIWKVKDRLNPEAWLSPK
ncbi:Septal ring factor EnvC, activator of murein hydrolases AmiA and AmiB [Flexibacter flexilis DSM 6793]|uniref:Septal ring factor EnvC, activator of murein hydrolases AmiA and AmiB n=1 Tax=Flexibacter flexilis DSM 6793 TaxID=927664 RepID=A0A1I1MPV1_9BACT|nr:peptidoglycan DD-metalloendopeptidase family protein [Flexibacter flexilis]SFC87497.1 Septal ring factor EnvC, activator of murein hydrolases AmiA and AmiB [Flexibacter flexilis DSM 6793]